MDAVNTEKLGLEQRKRHDPGLEALLNPDYKQEVAEILNQVEKGTLGTEPAHKRIIQMLVETASRDEMTCLLLGKAMTIKLERLMEYSRTTSTPLTVIYMDGDNFREINNQIGHEAGDKTIRAIADALREATREDDIQVRLSKEVEEEEFTNQKTHEARMGGDEFAVALPDTTAEQAIAVLGRFREKLAKHTEDVPQYEQKFGQSLTVSAGIAQYDPLTDNYPSDLINHAEKAMRESKLNGKGGVQIAENRINT